MNLLSELLANNAIAYPQEKKSKDWTFNYYLANARYRLRDLPEKLAGLDIEPINPPRGKQTPKDRWEYAQAALERAIDYLERKLQEIASLDVL